MVSWGNGRKDLFVLSGPDYVPINEAVRAELRATGPGQYDVGPLLLGDLRHPEGERCVGEDAGDHDVLAVEQTHVRTVACGP